MSSLVSGRPETSLPAEESAKPTVVLSSSDGHDETGQTDDEGLFIPHVFDLIWHTRNAAKYVSSPSFPSLYLEPQAVDTSTLIGDGASFTVSRRSIPKDSSEEYATNGFVDRVTRAPSKRPDYVVYKTARIAFTPEGEAVQRDRRAMASVMMEIYALVHPPLLNHPNVVSYVGLAWGSNPYEPTHRLPILVVEHADYGTLAGLQEKEFLPSKTRQSLCLDVALGLDVLHRCGIVHGDVKAENVLIFANLRSQYPPYIAKVADFGFSTVEAAASIAVNVGGTRPWKAPETDRPVPRAQLRQTDVYSFGLLVWRVGTDGKNPFEFLASPTAVEQLKQSDELLGSSKVSGWYPKYVSQRSKFYDWPIIPMRELLQNFRQYLSNPASTNVGRLDRIMSQLTTPEFLPYTAGFNLDIVQQFVGTRAATDPFYGKLDELFRSCLCLDPDRRNMADVIALLQTGLEVRPSNIPDGDILLYTSYDHHTFSWQKMGELDPGVQTFIFDTLLNRLQRNMAKNEINPPECFILAAFYINSLGTDRNDKEAARLIRLAAYNGHQHAQAYACRICRALSTSFVPDDATVSNLCVSALKGSRTALKDLQQVAPDQVPYINTRLRNTLGGVGANFFHKDQMLHSLSHWAWTDMLTSRATIADKLRGVKNKVDFRINKRGDRMLHFAASCGYLEAVMALIEDYFIDVNQLNDQGETPLLCACRASQVEVTQYLINHGADVSISTADKESPMHWLVSFEGDDVTTIGLALHACGGNVRLITMRDIAHSVFPGGIDCDHQVPGTPLSWAVHHDRPDIVRFFLDIAADPSICLIKPPNRGPTDPLTWAAHYHHTECLKLMIDALTKANMVYTFGPLIEYATHSADVFSMMLRHGSNYQARLKQTFDYLLESSAHIIFSTGIGGFGSTLLYYAVAIDKPAVVDYLLSQSMQSMLAVNQVVTEQLALETGSDDQITFTPANLMTYSAKGKHATTRDISVTPVVPKPRSEPQTGAFISQHINQACGERRRTPILESVRLNSSPMFRVLLASGADPKAKARNPFVSNRLDWTALHIFAHEGHNTRLKLVDDLISLGVLVDGDASFAGITETPTTVAIQNNAFNLASRLLELGADINALSMSSGLVATKYPTTILGQIITFNARHSTPRLRYILSDCSASARIKFIVEPERQLSALHRAALANHYLFSISSDSASPLPLPRVDYDMATNRETMYELLQLFNTPEQLNLRCNIQGRTALHLAVEACNIGVVRELTSLREVDLEAVDEGGETPASLLRFMLLQPHDAWIGKMLMEMRSLLPFLKEKVNCETEGLSQLVEAKLGLN